MQIDRTRFLLLTATIAACAPKPADTADADVNTVDIEPSGNDPFVVERTGSAGEPEEVDAQCKALKPGPGPHCESFDDTVEDCAKYRAVLEPTAAEQASACLASKSGSKAICEFGVSSTCFMAGASKVSPSQESVRACLDLVSQCRHKPGADLTLPGCRAAYSAVRNEQRNALVTCFTESCSVRNCFWSLEPR
jgi:hypothetical protein